MNGSCWARWGLLGLLTAAGCDARPRAPVIGDSPVYRNAGESLRFLVPEGWLQAASANLPRGKLDGEVLLTQYRLRTPGKGASLEVLCFDEGLAADLRQYHAEPSHGISNWQAIGPPESLRIENVAGERWLYSAIVGTEKEPMLKEVVVVRRRQRVYSFIGLFWESDHRAREQIRRAVSSMIWD